LKKFFNYRRYEKELMICSWRISWSRTYNVCLATCTCFLPIPIIAVCYCRLYT